jgi:teichuronic acid biosynthesis glycosyltransferase TuaH
MISARGGPGAVGELKRPGTRPDRDPVDVVFSFSCVTWQAASRRGFFMPEDRLAQSLIQSERVGRLLICNVTRSLPIKLLRDLSHPDETAFPADERTHLIQPLAIRRRDPARIARVGAAFKTYDRMLQRAVQKHRLRDPIVITGHPLVAGFSELDWARSVTWYAIDDWSEHPMYSRWWNAYRESYAHVRTRRRRVAAVSQELLDRLAPTGPGLVVSNGIQPEEWVGDPTPPKWIDGLSGPIYLYVGALDTRLDVEWLRQLALAEPSATVLLVGPLANPDHLAPISGLANVQIRPPVSRQELTGLVRAADVGLLPHLVTRLTKAMSPLKLLEYLAAGLPVAATDLEPVRAVGSANVRLVPEGGDFVQAVRAAHALGRAPEGDRLDFLTEHSWRARHDMLLDLALA